MQGFSKRILDRAVLKPLRYLRRRTGVDVNAHTILWQRAAVSSADYIEPHIGSVLLFETKRKLWDYALDKCADTGLFLEFGVFKGESINYFAKRRPQQKFHGFDSFVGLKEDWLGHFEPKGAFDVAGKLPQVRENVTLIPGWFDETLPRFLSDNSGNAAFIHIDSDTFEAAQTVLDLLKERIGKGTIVVFDEYLGYPNWQNGEYRAWTEFVGAAGLDYRYLGFCPEQAVLEVL